MTSASAASDIPSLRPSSPGHRKRPSDIDLHPSITQPMKRSTSTPVAASAAMVSSEQIAGFDRQRQGLIMMTTFISSAIREKKQGNPKQYEELIVQLTTTKPAPLSSAKLLQWTQALSQCISLFDKSCSALIDAMLQLDWISQDDNFVQYYLTFMGNVVSAHAFYVIPVQSMLVKKLSSRAYRPSGESSAALRQRHYDRAHQALKYILGLIPTGRTSLFPLLAAEFPHKRESINAQTTFVKNILRVLDYAPDLRAQILGVVIDRIIQIDVEIQVELEELEDSDTEITYDYELDDEEEDSDNDLESDDGNESDDESEAEEVAVLNIKEMTHKLDGMLYYVFSYLESVVQSCRSIPSQDGHPPLPIQELFMTLLSIFMKTILQTYKSRHTQFVLFYFVSLSPQFSDYFLGTLGEQILNKSRPEVVRVAAAAYMSSYVARAKYLDVRQVGMVIEMLGGFTLGLVEQVDTSPNVGPDTDKYAVFYATVQALLYIFCFRWKVLVIDGVQTNVASNRDDFDSAGMIVGGAMDSPAEADAPTPVLRQWHPALSCLQRIVTSRLNPLKMCSDNVVKQFARISNNLNFMYIYPILEQNKRIIVAPSRASSTLKNGIADGGRTVNLHELETFFPFDPYRLRQSAPFMQGIYQEWENDDEDEDDEDEDDEDDDEDEDEEIDDDDDEEQDDQADEDEVGHQYLGRHNALRVNINVDDDDDNDEHMNQSIMAMSISPSPAHFLVQGMTNRTK
ncbi:hypothetical protein BGW38_002672 [Lunasporangiospora selenospora]|uniref:RNA polymerase I-specific transcription initiation factor RRN3 n=1 Tax=Lunasporangiospora selenospora TaxID=979761 RepID=A0A9P6FTR7_9FUNG|nr:hypothetical protein BGW38_002672 [Lunasporangiospora selenospora]